MISIYDYLDYRRFLKDRFSFHKQTNPRFSYRFFNRLAGVRSSGFLKLVTDGKRNLAQDGIRMIVKGFKLTEEEQKYFECLVRFNQARSHEEKNASFKELSQNRRFLRSKPLTAAQYHLFSHWYYVAILELVRLETEATKDPRWLETHINPPVGLREIKKAVQELHSLGLLTSDSRGNLDSTEKMVSTPDEVQSISVANFHVQMSELAARAVLKEEASDREFSALTIAISEQGFQRAKKEIQEFRRKLHSILEQQEEGHRRVRVGHGRSDPPHRCSDARPVEGSGDRPRAGPR